MEANLVNNHYSSCGRRKPEAQAPPPTPRLFTQAQFLMLTLGLPPAPHPKTASLEEGADHSSGRGGRAGWLSGTLTHEGDYVVFLLPKK